MHSSSLLSRTFASVSLVLLIGATPAAAQVRAPGNEKALPESAQKAPPFQQSDGGGSTGPRIAHGSFVTNPSGMSEQHSGFSVLCEPAGARGTEFDAQVTFGSNVIFVADTAGFFAGQFLLIADDPSTAVPEGQFYQISRIAGPSSIELTQIYAGASGMVAAKRETLLFTTCNVTLDDLNPSTVVITARGNQPAPGEQFLPAAIIAQIEQGEGPLPADGDFQFFLMSPGFPPHNPGGTGTVDFIAVGN